jgi:hypothetical protein
MQALILLVAGIARLIVAVGIIYILFKLGKFLDVLPDVLTKRKEEPQ